MRNLVTVRTVRSIDAIPDADAIELARVDGWQVVVKKGEFKAGDRCLYFEIDSVVPELTPFLFLNNFRELYNGKRGSVIKTIKLRGQVSQGLALPMSVLDLLGVEDASSVGDLSDAIGVWKYDPPPPTSMGGNPVGRNPSWFAKTDEERVQNVKPEFLSGDWTATEKIDGTSMSIWKDGDVVGVGGHNWQFPLDSDNSFARIARESRLAEAIAQCVEEKICIQGELAGPGIQGNRLKLDHLTLFIFMVQTPGQKLTQKEIDGLHWWLVVKKGVDSSLVKLAPRVLTRSWTGTQSDIDEAIQLAHGPSTVNPIAIREGLVFRNVADGNKSFKSISAKYLLKG